MKKIFWKISLLIGIFSIFSISFIYKNWKDLAVGEEIKKKRVDFKNWPQVNFGRTRILFANNPYLSSQGFAGAKEEEFKNTIIIFPDVEKEVIFTNRDMGFGPVLKDIKILYLDKNYNILKEDYMEKITGISKPPKNTKIAIEGLP